MLRSTYEEAMESTARYEKDAPPALAKIIQKFRLSFAAIDPKPDENECDKFIWAVMWLNALRGDLNRNRRLKDLILDEAQVLIERFDVDRDLQKLIRNTNNLEARVHG